MPINRRLDKDNVVDTHNGMLLSLKKELKSAICSNIDVPQDYHTERNKSDREKQMLYDIADMWNPKKRYK